MCQLTLSLSLFPSVFFFFFRDKNVEQFFCEEIECHQSVLINKTLENLPQNGNKLSTWNFTIFPNMFTDIRCKNNWIRKMSTRFFSFFVHVWVYTQNLLNWTLKTYVVAQLSSKWIELTMLPSFHIQCNFTIQK